MLYTFPYLPSLASRSWYLDTNALRIMGKKLKSSYFVQYSYTSALSLIELISEIDNSETDFQVRKSALTNLLSSDVLIDWEMFDIKQRAAFTALEKNSTKDRRVDCLKTLISILIKSESFDSFISQSSSLNLEFNYLDFKHFDKNIGIGWREAAASGFREFKQAYLSPSTSQLCELLGLPGSAKRGKVVQELKKSFLNYQLTLYAMAEKFSEEIGITNIKEQQTIFDSYNHTIDSYVKAFSFLSLDSMSGNAPERNDGLDILHFLYMRPTSLLVSNDSKLTTLARHLGIQCIPLQAA